MYAHKLIVAGVVAGYFALLGSATNAFGAEKARKPVICQQFEVIKRPGRVIALCYDGKQPKVLVRFVTIEIPVAENDTDTRVVAIGYTKVGE